MNNPQFVIFTGPMFSAKTTGLLSAIDRYKYQGKKVVVFKPRFDDRYSQEDVSTHSGWKVPNQAL
jgi:thymidine kinase